MTEQHVPIEDLAAYAAGDLDAPAAVAVEAHVLLCPDCRADVDAVNATTAALAAVPPATMPPEVAARLDTALAAAAGGPVGTVLPMRRKRPTWEGFAAAAVVVLLVAGIAFGATTRGHSKSASTAAGPAAADQQQRQKAATRRLASGLDYTRTTVAGTLARALGGATTGLTGGSGIAPNAATPPAPTGTSFAAPEAAARLAPIEAEPARLAACLRDLGPGQVPLVIDFARFAGKPAVVVVFPHVSSNGTVSNKVDVWVAGPGCGTVPGGDVLDFQRIDRPPI